MNAKLKKSNKLIKKVVKQESVKYVSLAVGKKLGKVLYIDAIDVFTGTLKSKGFKKVEELVEEKIEELGE